MVQAAWSILVFRYTDNPDVIFGTTVSGRSIGLEDVEHIVGLLINTIPVRVNVEASSNPHGLLYALQRQQFESEPHSFLPLTQIKECSQVSPSTFLHLCFS